MPDPLLRMANYEFNIRSFHPEKSFGWSGLYFNGDDRGFSLKPSKKDIVTSRIWHRLELHTGRGTLVKETKSDKSRAPWATSSEAYNVEELAPTSDILNFSQLRLGNHRKGFRVSGRYKGANHAMPFSPELKKNLGFTYVPSIDVNYRIKMDLDREKKHMDLVVYITGDGFPNCEAFIVGPGGVAVFIGVHVRRGLAPVTLAMNLGYPMIVCAIRLPLDADGKFKGTIGDELARRSNGARELTYQSISAWNSRFLEINPNHGRCMLAEESSLEGCFNQ